MSPAAEIIAAAWGDLLLTVREYPDGNIAGVTRFMFTTAILSELTPHGYERRWCYHRREDALAAFAAWDGTGEPAGWHRNPETGRRRPDGDPALEYIAR